MEKQGKNNSFMANLNELKYYQFLADSMMDVFLLIQDEKIIFANTAASTVFAYSIKELWQMTIWELVAPCHFEKVKRFYYLRQKNSKIPGFYEMDGVKKDGRYVNAQLSVIPVKYQGKYAIQVIIKDISEQKKFAHVLQLSEEKYRKLFDYFLAGITVIQDEHVVFINDAGLSKMFYDIDEIQTIDIKEFIYSDDYPQIAIKYSRLLNEEILSFRQRFRIINKKGQVLWVEGAANLIEHEKRKAVQFITLDVTSHIRQEELKEEVKLQSGLLSNVNDCIIVADSEYKIILWNKGAEELFGWNDSEVLGMHVKELLELSGYKKDKLDLEEAVMQGRDWQGKVNNFITLNGMKKSFKLSVTTIKDELGKIKDIVGIATDITELIESKQQAQKANQAKSEFLANMSHEIRTPLVGILGFCELLSDENLNYRQKEYLSSIQYCSDQLLELVNNILDLSKIEAQQLEINSKPILLHEMIKQIIKSIQPQVDKNGLQLYLNINKDLPETVLGDEVKIRQVLSNLLFNAIKFTEKGFIRVDVERADFSYSINSEDYPLKFTVYDTGVGVPVDKQEIIFEPFIQVDNSNRRKYSGSGLGLAISKKLIERMRGRIGVESNEDGGSSFSFLIPLRVLRENRRFASCSLEADEHETTDILSLPGKKILLAEDIAVNRKLITHMLEDRGCSVFTARNGVECLETLKSNKPDLILMDMQMPVMDGYAATGIIRSSEIWDDIPIVALTAYAMSGDIEKCLKYGCDNYLSKPFTQEQLLQMLIRMLQKKKNSS